MKKLAIIALVVLVLVVGLPLAMGMSDMAPCPNCTGINTPEAVTMCLAIVSLFVLIVSSYSSRIASGQQMVNLRLLADPPERPPRAA
jgi:hypothetical protein